jgi:hypothetical protein
MDPFAYILPPETAQIHCGATGLALFRRPYEEGPFALPASREALLAELESRLAALESVVEGLI